MFYSTKNCTGIYTYFYKKTIILPGSRFSKLFPKFSLRFFEFFLTFSEINWLKWVTHSLLILYT